MPTQVWQEVQPSHPALGTQERPPEHRSLRSSGHMSFRSSDCTTRNVTGCQCWAGLPSRSEESLGHWAPLPVPGVPPGDPPQRALYQVEVGI